MGDRANICFREKNGGEMYFYTHWNGYKIASVLREALERGRDRWDDEQYLARIIFSEMIKDDVLENTGFGLGTKIGDGGLDFVVDMKTRNVLCEGRKIPFEKFISKRTDPRKRYS